jgi:hypothetical protein
MAHGLAIVLTMRNGSAVRLDRNLRLDQVAATINNSRGAGKLIQFGNDRTPPRNVWVDPAEVMRVEDAR